MALRSKTDYNDTYNYGGCILPKKSFFALLGHYKAYLITTISLFICIISFQNCTPDVALEDGSEENTSLSDETPFAFDVSIDHFALMTCQKAGLNHAKKDGQFTYKWGAYQNGMASTGLAGLKLSDDFKNRYQHAVPAKLFTVLEESEKNKNLEITSGLYTAGEYNTRKGDNKTSVYRNHHNSLQVNSYRMDLSLNRNKTLAYFPGAPMATGLNRSIEGVMFRRTLANESVMVGAYKDEFTATVNHDRLANYPVAIGFGHASELAKSEAKPLISKDGGYTNNTAVGRSYLPIFTGVRSTHLRYLGSVRESNLDGNSSFSSWGCPAQLRLKIVQREDIEAGEDRQRRASFCKPSLVTASALAANDSKGRALRSIANILDLSIWEVGLDMNNSANNCIVRRSNFGLDTCYTKNNPYVNSQGKFESTDVIRVDYSNNQSICGSSNPIRNEPYISGGPNRKTFYTCPHYVSICVKYK